MTDQLKKSVRAILKVTPDAISSQELDCGTTRLTSRDGQKIYPFGQEVAHVNHLVQQVDKKVKQTIDIYGLNGSASLASADLQYYLESRLQTLLPKGGLMMFIKGWNRKTTPLGRLYCQLAVSVRPIKEIDYGLWPSPTASAGGPTKNPKNPRGIHGGNALATAAMWATVTVTDAYKRGNITPRKGAMGLSETAALWVTPSARDHKDTPGMAKTSVNPDGSTRNRNDQLGRQVFGSTVQTENKGSLNPEFPCWLMGIPSAWVSSIVQGMRSCPKSPQHSYWLISQLDRLTE